MALLQDLIKQVDDPELRERILMEVNKLNKQKKFGLVFEEHLPECTPLYDVRIKRGSKVALKAGKVDCVIIDNEPAKAYVAANEGLKILETSYADEDYAIAVSKDNPELKDAIDAALKELIADGSLQKIVDKYIPA